MVASTHLRPHDIQRLVRTVAPATAVARTLTGAGAAAAFPSAIFRTPINTAAFRASNPNFNSAATRISVVKWTMLPCAVPRPYTHPDASAQSLGFRRSHSHISSASSPYSSSAEEKGKIPPASGPLMPPKMCSDDEKGGGAWCSKPSPPHPLRHRSPTSRLLNLPTILTLGRVAAVPLLVGAFYINSWWGTTATTSIFIAAAITDWLDGYIARKMKLGTAFGAFLDPVADKLMVAVTLVLLCSRPFEIGGFGQVPLLLTVPAITIIGREITMSAVREWAASQNSKLTEAVAVNNLGKWKTAMQMTALTILLASRDNNVAGAGIVAGCGVGLLNVSAGLAMWSLVVYMRKIWPVLLNS